MGTDGKVEMLIGWSQFFGFAGARRWAADCLRIKDIRKGIVLLFLVSVVTTLTLWTYTKGSENSMATLPPLARLRPKESVSDRFRCSKLRVASKKKTILLWFVPFDDPGMLVENLFIDQMPSDRYKISWNNAQCGNCRISYDRDLVNKSDAVVFHAFYPNGSDVLPPRSFRGQKYIWWSQESQQNVPYSEDIREYFEWTMTPSRRSQVFSPYATFPWILKFWWRRERGHDVMVDFMKFKDLYPADNYELGDVMRDHFNFEEKPRRKIIASDGSIKILMKKKMKIAAWIASNCHTAGAYTRMYIVDEMEESGLKVDRMGSCYDEWFDISRWDPAFYTFLSRYKFYLSFENSVHCSDYITEKLWFNALYSGTVPVVWGPSKEDVRSVLPPKSYIHVEDFYSIKDLVKYLKYLDRNDTAYAEYLEWTTWTKYLDNKGEYKPGIAASQSKKSSRPSKRVKTLLDNYAVMKPVGFCRLCLLLHSSKECRRKSFWQETETELPPDCLGYDEGGSILKNLTVMESYY